MTLGMPVNDLKQEKNSVSMNWLPTSQITCYHKNLIFHIWLKKEKKYATKEAKCHIHVDSADYAMFSKY